MYFLKDYVYKEYELYNDEPIDLVQGVDFDVQFGATEKIEGLNIQNFDPELGMCKDGYESLRHSIGYPPSKDFRVYYVGPAETVSPTYNDGTLTPQYICNDFPEPYQQADVYVKEIVTTAMDELGNKEQLRVNMQVW
jgi:hypothetical protein